VERTAIARLTSAAARAGSPRAAPHTPETARLFDVRTLALLRHTSYLINVGRGAIVVLNDLVAALRAGRLAGAALDVYEVEPLPADHPLWDYSNVILTRIPPAIPW